jgi:hypothetical protein
VGGEMMVKRLVGNRQATSNDKTNTKQTHKTNTKPSTSNISEVIPPTIAAELYFRILKIIKINKKF